MPPGVATMPSTFQLFPYPLVDWVVNINGQPLKFDLFDVEFWRHYEWSIFDHRIQRRISNHPEIWPAPDVFERWFEKRLGRARRFVWSIMVPSGNVPLIEPLLLGADCVPTPRRLVFENIGGQSVARLRPEQIVNPMSRVDYETLMFAPGDGSVTKSSLLSRQDLSPTVPRHEHEGFESHREVFVCTEHDELTSNDDLLDSLIEHLLAPELDEPR